MHEGHILYAVLYVYFLLFLMGIQWLLRVFLGIFNGDANAHTLASVLTTCNVSN